MVKSDKLRVRFFFFYVRFRAREQIWFVQLHFWKLPEALWNKFVYAGMTVTAGTMVEKMVSVATLFHTHSVWCQKCVNNRTAWWLFGVKGVTFLLKGIISCWIYPLSWLHSTELNKMSSNLFYFFFKLFIKKKCVEPFQSTNSSNLHRVYLLTFYLFCS